MKTRLDVWSYYPDRTTTRYGGRTRVVKSCAIGPAGAHRIIFGILAIAMPWVAGESILLMVGMLVMAAGIMIVTGFPLAGTTAIGVFLGIKLLLVGITILAVRSAVKNDL